MHRVGHRQELLGRRRTEVIGTAEGVGADQIVLRKILPGLGVLMEEGGVAAPVLRRAVGLDDLRHPAQRPLALQQTLGVVRRAVRGADGVGERWLAEPAVELSSPSAGQVSEHSVEHLAPGLVDVQPVEEELAKEAT